MIISRSLSTCKLRTLIGAICIPVFLFSSNASGQSTWIPQHRISSASLRGLSVVDDEIVWASGSEGTWLHTTDGGETWMTGTIPGASKLDFRDIHALNASQAWVLSAGDTCKIYYTSNGGWSWELQYTNYQKGIFFDGFAFWNETSALAYSDPIDGRAYVIKTTDGESWRAIDQAALPLALEGEAGFAASGTGICVKESTIWIATGGGERARVLRSTDLGSSWTAHDTPLMSKEGAGIFSMVFTTELQGVVVGGSYIDSVDATANCAVTSDGGASWKLISEKQPRGYRSCVAASKDGKMLITVGRTGSEKSTDNGISWTPIGEKGYFACALSKKYAWAVGRNGKVGKLKLAP